jgi:FixJ family two-component response regulator
MDFTDNFVRNDSDSSSEGQGYSRHTVSPGQKPSENSIKIIPNSVNTKISVHLIEKNSIIRASMSRRLIATGFHAEIYSGIQEFASFCPKDGIVLVNDENHNSGLIGMIDSLNHASPGMPVIVYCDQPTIDGVVAAMRAHAVNYLSLDVSDYVLADTIQQAFAETQTRRAFQKRIAECAATIQNLSPRELQVLELLVEGESNKGMARHLGLSPRTVEIHRMKLMGKLGAKTSAQAVKIWCTASLVH